MDINSLFLGTDARSRDAYKNVMRWAQEIVTNNFASLKEPYSGMCPDELTTLLNNEVCPEEGVALQSVLTDVGTQILPHAIAVHHPRCVAHLHCPPMLPSLASEAVISALNASMDSWDQSAVATIIEQKVTAWLCKVFQLGERANGTFTSGGTQSNLMGLLLARNYYCEQMLEWDVQLKGLPPISHKLRILCSEAAHFTVKQSAAILGLGAEAVITVPTDEDFCLCPLKLAQQLSTMTSEGYLPFAIVATAGTTDYGSFDPLPQISTLAKTYGCWLHVDAAFGGAFILSEQHRHLLQGINLADSLAIDFHKMFYQPISCGALLLKDEQNFTSIRFHAQYLNPLEDEAAGIPHLVTNSLQTSRRFDALKCWISLQTLGAIGLANILDKTVDLARETARLFACDSEFELINSRVSLNTVLFRYLFPGNLEKQNKLNRLLRQELFNKGTSIVAQTTVGEKTCLKFTLLNPKTTINDLKYILNEIKTMASTLGQQKGANEQYVSELG